MNPTILSKLQEWKNSPLLFVTECIGAVPSDQQADALVKIKDAKRLSIRSGHGTGKDAFAAWVALWFEATRTFPKVICTAPTARQLSDILWSEISKWLRHSLLSEEFVIQQAKIFHKDHPKEWWIRGISPNIKASKEEQAETLAGIHGDHVLVIVDEAHKFRNIKSKRRTILANLPRKNLLLLTATPLCNKITDLYSLIDLIYPGRVGTESAFKSRYAADTKCRVVRQDRVDQLRNIVSEVMCRTRRVDTDIPFTNRIVESRRIEAENIEYEFIEKATQYLKDICDNKFKSIEQLKYENPASSKDHSESLGVLIFALQYPLFLSNAQLQESLV